MNATSSLRCAWLIASLVLPAAVYAQNADAPPPESNPSTRFVANPDDTVTDTETGIIWSAKDNGSDINWPDAQSYCASKGAGWSLPTADQLLKLYDTRDPGQPCIGLLTCKVTQLIQVSGLTPWTSQANGESEAWYVYLNDGKPYAYKVSDTPGKRALCVRTG